MTDTALVPQLSKEAARRMTDEVRHDVHSLWRKVLALYEGGAHLALGYDDWSEYWTAEFGGSGHRGTQLVRAGRVVRALEAGDGDLPLPANDSVARQLLPVYRYAPEDLTTVWQRAVQVTGGTPTTAQVAEIVEPYRRRRNLAHDPAQSGATRRKRNLAGVPIVHAHSNALGASSNLADALDARPSVDVLREWLEHAEEAARIMSDVAAMLREHLSTRDQGEDTVRT